MVMTILDYAFCGALVGVLACGSLYLLAFTIKEILNLFKK